MAKKITPAAKSTPAPAKALAPAVKPKVADPVAVIASPAVVEKSEVKGSGRPAKAPAPSRDIGYTDIANRAFEIYASRGYAAGNPQADWYEAERQLRAGL